VLFIVAPLGSMEVSSTAANAHQCGQQGLPARRMTQSSAPIEEDRADVDERLP
jgi:hypothetical protein